MLKTKSPLPKPDSIPAPPLFIEEVSEGRRNLLILDLTIVDFRFQPHRAHAFFIFNFQFSIFNCKELPPGYAVLSPKNGLELALVRQTTSKLSVCPHLLAGFPL